MSALDDTLAHWRNDLQAREAVVLRELLALYHDVIQAIERELEPILAEIAATQAAGEPVQMSLLVRRGRLSQIERDVIAELQRITGKTYALILAEQAHAARSGAQSAIELLDAAMGDVPPGAGVEWARLNPRAVEAMVGRSSNGTPLRALLDALPANGGAAVRSALVRGVALGKNPRVIAREIREGVGRNVTRALTISRTESLHAYREANIRSWAANSNVVRGWTWICACDRRSCAMCWAMHGSFHTLDESMDTHPNCRCAPAPATRTWSELFGRDLPETAPNIPMGEDLFERQSDAVKRQVLGPAKYAAYQRGELRLSDLVGMRDHPVWGPTRYERPLVEILGSRGASGRAARAAARSPRTSGGGGGGRGGRAFTGRGGGGGRDIDQMLLDLPVSGGNLRTEEMRAARQHTVRQGFFTSTTEVVGDRDGKIAGTVWKGRVLKASDTLPSLDVHWLRHRAEWPDGSTLKDYLRDVQDAVLGNGPVLLSIYQKEVHISFLGATGDADPKHAWLMVDYRPSAHHIMTAYKVASPQAAIDVVKRSNERWLIPPP